MLANTPVAYRHPRWSSSSRKAEPRRAAAGQTLDIRSPQNPSRLLRISASLASGLEMSCWSTRDKSFLSLSTRFLSCSSRSRLVASGQLRSGSVWTNQPVNRIRKAWNESFSHPLDLALALVTLNSFGISDSPAGCWDRLGTASRSLPLCATHASPIPIEMSPMEALGYREIGVYWYA